MAKMKLHVARSALRFAGVLLMLLAAASMPGQAQAQENFKTTEQSRILALEHAWNQAEELRDLKALDGIFDDAFVYIDFDGSLLAKGSFLARVKNAPLVQVITESMTVQIFESTAIVTGTYRSSEMHNGKPLRRQGRFIDTWVFRNRTWVCVAAQATPIL